MLVGKRRCFEDEPNEQLNTAYAFKRRMNQEKQLETLSQARKRLTQSHIHFILDKYPEANATEISRLLDDLDNNVEMVLELMGQKTKIPLKIDLDDSDTNNFKAQITQELLKRLRNTNDIELAKQQIQLCFDAFETTLNSRFNATIEKLQQENKILKQAFLKQNQRLERQKGELELKDKQYDQSLKAFQDETNKQKQINNNLTILLIQAQQQSQCSLQPDHDIY